MIKIVITKQKNQITKISIKGHANSGEYGKDLVCAGVSAISTGILNTLAYKQYIQKKMCHVSMKNGNIEIEVMQSNETLQVILETLVVSLETAHESNQKYIKITYREE